MGYSPWDCKELDTTEQLTFHFHLARVRRQDKTLSFKVNLS